MQKALLVAREAFADREVPVGCVIVDGNGEILSTGRNRCEAASDATAHAEMEAISKAAKKRGDWRLDDCTLVVTLEPCPMCTGAIINSRISTVVYGAKDEQMGSCGSVIDLFCENYHHHPSVFSGVLKDECAGLLKQFFKEEREHA